jgi:hypothetical protein
VTVLRVNPRSGTEDATMRHIATALALLGMLSAGCGRPAVPAAHGHAEGGNRSSDVVAASNAVFGNASTTIVTNVCAGQKALAQGAATVSDSCFTGATNVVLCTDMTSVNPVRCAPGPNSLTITGTGDDLISYARIR